MIRLDCDICGNDTFNAVYGAPRDAPYRFTFACAECGERVRVELEPLEVDA